MILGGSYVFVPRLVLFSLNTSQVEISKLQTEATELKAENEAMRNDIDNRVDHTAKRRREQVSFDGESLCSSLLLSRPVLQVLNGGNGNRSMDVSMTAPMAETHAPAHSGPASTLHAMGPPPSNRSRHAPSAFRHETMRSAAEPVSMQTLVQGAGLSKPEPMAPVRSLKDTKRATTDTKDDPDCKTS